ncbi:hypothetical protein SK128_013884 [Halocaridina rubra]|uniref:Uncharacterized protein n=1 Tax=Halocaridina rubra TaxID=373956 RepID=A0AAN8XA07_HALRR
MSTHSLKRFLTTVVIPVALVVCILLSLPLVCGHSHDHHGHSHHHHDGHAHHHHEEPPAFKWSKEANDPYVEDVGEEHVHDHEHLGVEKTTPTGTVPQSPKSSVWLDAMMATLVISIAPYLILFIIPVTNSAEHAPYLKILLAFASGGLLGDAFLHLIPHALMAQASATEGRGHSHSHSHETGAEGGHSHDMSIGLAVLGGIIAFLVVEKFVRLFKGSHSHTHAHLVPVKENASQETKSDKTEDKGKAKKKEDKEKKDKKGNNEEKKDCSQVKEEIKVAGYLNLAADFTHNLTDGLAIGASFLAGKSVGIVTTLTIFLHEIPHEIGDFAILLQSGCSRRKAMLLQLVTALGAITGTMISLLAEGADDSAIAWILPFTAGGFIYIATVSVIPELLENSRLWQSVFEIIALLSGVALMMAIAHLEEMGHDH